uniref:Thioredoxin n=1 Tax=Candidatus Methanomethylicus mesodigestus TaxID=1867258 RepID=A0A7C3J521_9CREN
MKPAKLALVAVVLLGAVVGAYSYYSIPREGFPGRQVINDHPLIEGALSNGKPILIYFSTMGCPTCLMQDGVMAKIRSNYNDTANIIFFKYDEGLGKVFQDWSIVKVPTIVLASSNGTVAIRHEGGYVAEDDLINELMGLG